MDQMPDYSKYTLEELYDVHDFMDREKYPDWFAVVEQEIEKRKSETKEKETGRVPKTSSRRWRKPLAVTEVIGGSILLISAIVGIYSIGREMVLIAIAACVIGVLAVVAGIGLYKDTPLGKKLSILLQALQLFSLSAKNLFYLLVAGLELKLSLVYPAGSVQAKGLNISHGIYGTLLIAGPGHGQPFGVGVNFIALSALLLLVFGSHVPEPRRGEPPEKQPLQTESQGERAS